MYVMIRFGGRQGTAYVARAGLNNKWTASTASTREAIATITIRIVPGKEAWYYSRRSDAVAKCCLRHRQPGHGMSCCRNASSSPDSSVVTIAHGWRMC